MNWLHGMNYDYPEGYEETKAYFPAYKQRWRRQRSSVIWVKGVVDHGKYQTHTDACSVPYADLPERTQEYVDRWVPSGRN